STPGRTGTAGARPPTPVRGRSGPRAAEGVSDRVTGARRRDGPCALAAAPAPPRPPYPLRRSGVETSLHAYPGESPPETPGNRPADRPCLRATTGPGVAGCAGGTLRTWPRRTGA